MAYMDLDALKRPLNLNHSLTLTLPGMSVITFSACTDSPPVWPVEENGVQQNVKGPECDKGFMTDIEQIQQNKFHQEYTSVGLWLHKRTIDWYTADLPHVLSALTLAIVCLGPLFTRGQFWPSGIVIACVCLCVRQSWACLHDNSSQDWARIAKFGPKNAQYFA